jgi:hypothetical protein
VADRSLFPPQERHQVVVLATTKPSAVGVATTRWSLDDLAAHILRDAHYRDLSRSTIQRVLADADLKPHKSRYWLHSADPEFEDKALDICRLYLDAPRLYRQGELVLCTDEKTSIQALERARPTKPAAPGQEERRDPEYLRHGTRCLLATLVVPTGQVLGSVTERRGRWDFVRPVRDVVEQFPTAERFHWVMDNLNTHYTWELCQYLGKLSGVWQSRPRLRTGAQRRAFLTNPEHKHVVHYTPKLAARIKEFIAYYDLHDAHPYEWTYTGKPLVSGDGRSKRKRLRHRRRQLRVNGRAP